MIFSHHEKITSTQISEGGSKVLLTNSARNKPGPKEADASAIYCFAHQAYWGFRFLSTERKPLLDKILLAKGPREVQEVGEECSKPGVMAGAGYGARGLMTWLKNSNVATQVIAAKSHRRYPRSERPSSRDRRMIFLGIAVAAGGFEIKFSTALRKLAQSGYGEKFFGQKVHNWDRIEETMKGSGFVCAEPVENYVWPAEDGDWMELEKLPCAIPKDFHGGFIIHGYTPDGQFRSVFSKTLPVELSKSLEKNEELNEKLNEKQARSQSRKGVK